MKVKLLFSFIIFLSAFACKGQDTARALRGKNIITLSPLLKLKYERCFSTKDAAVSAGIFFQSTSTNWLYDLSLNTFGRTNRRFEGEKGKLFIRLYTSPSKECKGFYFQGHVSIGHYSGYLEYGSHYDAGGWGFSAGNISDTTAKRSFTALGGGASIGNQWLLGKKKCFIIDLEIELDYFPLPKNMQTLDVHGNEKKLFRNSSGGVSNWNNALGSPGGLVSAMIGIGYRF